MQACDSIGVCDYIYICVYECVSVSVCADVCTYIIYMCRPSSRRRLEGGQKGFM